MPAMSPLSAFRVSFLFLPRCCFLRGPTLRGPRAAKVMARRTAGRTWKPLLELTWEVPLGTMVNPISGLSGWSRPHSAFGTLYHPLLFEGRGGSFIVEGVGNGPQLEERRECCRSLSSGQIILVPKSPLATGHGGARARAPYPCIKGYIRTSMLHLRLQSTWSHTLGPHLIKNKII